MQIGWPWHGKELKINLGKKCDDNEKLNLPFLGRSGQLFLLLPTGQIQF